MRKERKAVEKMTNRIDVPLKLSNAVEFKEAIKPTNQKPKISEKKVLELLSSQ